MGLESIGSLGTMGSYSSVISADSTKRKSEERYIIKTPDGKYVVLTKEQYLRYLWEQYNKYKRPSDDNGKVSKQEPYELGPKKDGERIIDIENVTDPLKPGTTAPSDNACFPDKLEEYKTNIEYDNGIIDDFKQGKRGDCYLLASIESIKRTKNGQQLLNDNVKRNSNGSYTVTLPGAVNARNHYIEQGYEDKCAITGVYTITPEAIEKAQSLSGKSYSYGDFNVILYELAMEAFRAEVLQTNAALGQKSEQYIAGQFGPMSDVDTLSGGQMYDAVYLLTGEKSDLYSAPRSKRANPKYYIPGEYGYVGEEQKYLGGKVKASKGIVEVNNVYDKDSDLQRMLDKYKGHEDEYSLTVGVYVGRTGPDGTTQKGGGHALTVTKITDNYVEVVNPWDTTKTERIPRADFEKMAIEFNVAKVPERANITNQNQNNALNGLLNFLYPFRFAFS